MSKAEIGKRSGGAKLNQSNHWYASDLWLGTGPFGELRDHSSWVEVPTQGFVGWNGGCMLIRI